MAKPNPVDNALECVERIATVRDIPALIEETRVAIKPFGFRWFAIGDLPEPIGRTTVNFLARIWPAAWRDRYETANYYAIDPVARHARGTTEPFLWSEARWNPDADSPAAEMMDEAKSHGLSEGLAIPIMAATGDLGMVSLAGRRISKSIETRRALQLISIYAHHRACELTRAEQGHQL